MPSWYSVSSEKCDAYAVGMCAGNAVICALPAVGRPLELKLVIVFGFDANPYRSVGLLDIP